MANIFGTNNPGIGGLDEITDAEALFLQNLSSLPYSSGDILYHDGTNITRLAKGADGEVLTLASGIPSWATGGGGGTPGGSDTQLQYNNAGVFGGMATTVWDDVNNRLGIGGTPTGNFEVTQPTTGTGTVSTTATGTTVTGVGTQFTNTFRVGDTITINAETQTITAIASDTSLTTGAWTGANSGVAYTLVGGSRLKVAGSGYTEFGVIGAPSVVSTALVKFSSETGLNSDWSFNVAGNGYPTMNFLSTAGTLASPTSKNGVAFALNAYMYNTLNAQVQAISIRPTIGTTSAGNENSYIDFLTMIGGNLGNILTLSNGQLTVRNIVAPSTTTGGKLVLSAREYSTALASGDQVSSILYRGSNGVGFNTINFLDVFASENWTGTAMGSELVLSTTPNGTTTAVPALTIANTGVITLAQALADTNIASSATWNAKEPALGNPSSDGYILSSTIAGVRSWVSAGAGDALTTNPLSQFAATTSLELAGVISDETGTGALVFGTSPTLVTPDLGTPSALVGTNITGSASGLNAGTATALETARLINGVSFDGTANITVTASAGTLTGTTLNSTVVTSSLTSLGTIATGVWNGTAIADTYISSAVTWNAKIANVSEDTTPQLGGELDAQANSIGFTLQTYTGVVGTTDIDFTKGNKHQFTFGAGDETLTFTAPTKTGNFVLEVIQDSTGGRLLTYPATVKWAGGTAPTLSTGAGAIDIISFYWNGTSYFGVVSLAFA